MDKPRKSVIGVEISDVFIPPDTIQKWQRTVDLMARVFAVPAALIMRVHEDQIEVFISCKTDEENPYCQGEFAKLNSGLYCETVIKTQQLLLVPDARKDPAWDSNPDIALNMVSYFGMPILDSRGKVFGTICALDSKEHDYSQLYQALLRQFKEIIESDIVILSELTEKVRLLAELCRSNQDLEDFAHVASHDLRAPLSSILSSAELLNCECGEKLDESAKEFLRIIVDATRRMDRLIHDILIYSQAGHTKLSLSDVDFNCVLGVALENLKSAIEESQAIITADSLPSLEADSRSMSQLFQNLILNAIIYRGSEPPRIHVSAARSGEEWIFSVQDNGIGITTEDQTKIFESFVRVAKHVSGSGLGLAICKRSIEQHHGRIWVESSPGKGAVFRFAIPCHRV